MNMKLFYAALGVVALIGIGWIWMSRSGGAAQSAPVSVNATVTGAFEGYPLGSDSAPVEVIEYSDFECPFCARFTILTMPDIRREFISTGEVRWRFRDYPLPQHPNAEAAHHAAACAAEQDRFWEMHDQLYFNQGSWVRERRPLRRLRTLAQSVGVDVRAYDDCMDERRYAARIGATKDAGAALGVLSTPTFIIGNRLLSGAQPLDSFRVYVERAKSASTP